MHLKGKNGLSQIKKSFHQKDYGDGSESELMHDSLPFFLFYVTVVLLVKAWRSKSMYDERG